MANDKSSNYKLFIKLQIWYPMVPHTSTTTKINFICSASKYVQLQTDHRWNLCFFVRRIYIGNRKSLWNIYSQLDLLSTESISEQNLDLRSFYYSSDKFEIYILILEYLAKSSLNRLKNLMLHAQNIWKNNKNYHKKIMLFGFLRSAFVIKAESTMCKSVAAIVTLVATNQKPIRSVSDTIEASNWLSRQMLRLLRLLCIHIVNFA